MPAVRFDSLIIAYNIIKLVFIHNTDVAQQVSAGILYIQGCGFKSLHQYIQFLGPKNGRQWLAQPSVEYIQFYLKKIEEPPIQFSIICKIEYGLWVCLEWMSPCHGVQSDGFESRRDRIYCTFGRVDRLQTFNLCKKLRQGFESLRVHIIRSSWFLGLVSSCEQKRPPINNASLAKWSTAACC